LLLALARIGLGDLSLELNVTSLSTLN